MTDQNNKLTFEEGMKELEKILSKLESDQTPLEEMVDLSSIFSLLIIGICSLTLFVIKKYLSP